MNILEFVLSSFWIFIGIVILLSFLIEGLIRIIWALRGKRDHPRGAIPYIFVDKRTQEVYTFSSSGEASIWFWGKDSVDFLVIRHENEVLGVPPSSYDALETFLES